MPCVAAGPAISSSRSPIAAQAVAIATPMSAIRSGSRSRGAAA